MKDEGITEDPRKAAQSELTKQAIERIRAQRQRLIDRPYDNDYIKGIILGLECALDQLGNQQERNII